jgi:hypothetical protein
MPELSSTIFLDTELYFSSVIGTSVLDVAKFKIQQLLYRYMQYQPEDTSENLYSGLSHHSLLHHCQTSQDNFIHERAFSSHSLAH